MTARRAMLALSFVIAVTSVAPPALAQHTRIQLPQLEAMFADMRAKTKWNIDGPLLWGYFFVDPDPAKLKQAAAELQASGYRIVNLAPVPEKQVYTLHIERIEAHTPVSLNDRNNRFYEFADGHAIASYDGMDVGPVPPEAR